ncbi:MAG: hypothetical protein NVS3B26_22720 [Mycobacteriales bacterium]
MAAHRPSRSADAGSAPPFPAESSPVPTGQLASNGHAMHVTHATRLAASPGGWRGGGVTAVSSDGTLTVDYISAPGSVVA